MWASTLADSRLEACYESTRLFAHSFHMFSFFVNEVDIQCLDTFWLCDSVSPETSGNNLKPWILLP